MARQGNPKRSVHCIEELGDRLTNSIESLMSGEIRPIDKKPEVDKIRTFAAAIVYIAPSESYGTDEIRPKLVALRKKFDKRRRYGRHENAAIDILDELIKQVGGKIKKRPKGIH